MATDVSFVKFVVDQIDESCDVSYRMMFGEYALYSRGKIVGLMCDNRLLMKPTEAGRAFIGDVVEAPPYPGAKPAFLIEDKIEDREWLTELVMLTEEELPAPKPKRKRKAKTKRKAKAKRTSRAKTKAKANRKAAKTNRKVKAKTNRKAKARRAPGDAE